MSSSISTIAMVCHEVNRLYCESQGDFSQVPWGDAPDSQVRSLRSGVLHLMTNPDAMPEDSHTNWLKDKRADGWVYGDKKDLQRKTHPCMKPYDCLPIQQRRKDAFFHTIVRGMTQ